MDCPGKGFLGTHRLLFKCSASRGRRDMARLSAELYVHGIFAAEQSISQGPGSHFARDTPRSADICWPTIVASRHPAARVSGAEFTCLEGDLPPARFSKSEITFFPRMCCADRGALYKQFWKSLIREKVHFDSIQSDHITCNT